MIDNPPMKLQVYQCVHCEKKFVVLETVRGTVLPVEVAPDKKIDADEIFDGKIHKSHLLNCPERQQDWNKVREKFMKKSVKGVTQKDLLK